MADTVLTELKIHEFDTLEQMSQYESEIGDNDLVLTPDTTAKLFLFKHAWADYVVSEMSWLRADTFSWHSGETYEAAYEHLAKDYDSSDFEKVVWGYNESGHIDVYTKTGNPEVGTPVYDTDIGEEIGTVSALGDNYIDVDTLRFYRARDFDVMSHSDTIGDITIRYALGADGHKICLPDQESNLVALYESTGVAWYYILDTANKQFKLPRTKYGFVGIRDSVGNYVPESLPNITGEIGAFQGTSTGDKCSGAFVYTSYTKSTYGGANSAENSNGATFDASLSSSAYKDNAPVQERATQMYLYFYVGNFGQTAVEQTAGVTTETLNGKADIDLGNLPTNIDYVVESQEPTSSNSYTWYRKYKSGWVEQGGRVNLNGVISATNKRVTFPVEMVDSKYAASVDINANVGAVAYVGWESTTGMSVGLTSGTSTGQTSWRVAGMAKQ